MDTSIAKELPTQHHRRHQSELPGRRVLSDITTTESRGYESEPDPNLSPISARPVLPKVESEVDLDLSPRPHLALGTLTILSFVVAYNSTNTITSLGKITHDFASSNAVMSFWIATSYFLASTVFQPLFAPLSAAVGRARVLIISILCLILGSLVAGVAQTIGAIIAGRALQGIGASGCLALIVILPPRALPSSKQNIYLRFIHGSQAVGFVFGGIIGGAFTQNVTWRLVFLFNLPFCVLALIAIPFSFHLHRGAGLPLRQMQNKLDLIGVALFTLSLTILLIGISWSGILVKWDSAWTVVPYVLGAICLLVGAAWQLLGSGHKFMRHRLFSRKTANIAYIGVFIQSFVLYSQLFLLAIYISATKATNAISTSAILLALLLSIAVAFIATAFLTKSQTDKSHYTKLVWAGFALQTLSSGLMILFSVKFSKAGLIIILILSGLGHGILMNVLDHIIQSYANDADNILATTMISFFRSLGICVGITASSCVFLNRMARYLRRENESGSLSQHAVQLLVDLPRISDSWSSKITVLGSYAFAFRGVAVLLTCLGAIALVASLFMSKRPTVVKARVVSADPSPRDEPEVRGDRPDTGMVSIELSDLDRPSEWPSSGVPSEMPRHPPPRPARSTKSFRDSMWFFGNKPLSKSWEVAVPPIPKRDAVSP